MRTVHYVIAVHGIGQQIKNQTVLPVISQFAAVRHNHSEANPTLTLALLASQSTDNNWVELAEIPAKPDSALHDNPWQPKAADSPKGENIRFLDFVWSQVTDEDQAQVGESVKSWSGKLINRLQARRKQGVEALDWVIDVMKTTQEGVLLIQKILNKYAFSMSHTVFTEFLGDVEMYGDFPNTRGKAVRLFHEFMEAVHNDHFKEFKDQSEKVIPQYTIIAHSLGTVMTLDGIMYAHANSNSRSSDKVSAGPSVVHFPGYDGKAFSNTANLPSYMKGPSNQQLPETDWVAYLSSYVTLGSPIDKFLALWTENYLHLESPGWIDGSLIKKRQDINRSLGRNDGGKIMHFNYSDELDPVGFELNILQSTKSWNLLMENAEDVVFARYPVPGLAHVEYWDDYEVMRRILDMAIDKRDKFSLRVTSSKSDRTTSKSEETLEKPDGCPVGWFKLKAYIKGLACTHVAVPFIGWAVSVYFFQSFVDSISGGRLTQAILPYLMLVATTYITDHVMKLLIMWRLVMSVSYRPSNPLQKEKWRKYGEKIADAIVKGTPFLWLILFGLSFLIPVIECLSDFFGLIHFPFDIISLQILLLLALLVASWVAWLDYEAKRRWKSLAETIAKTFNNYTFSQSTQSPPIS